MGVFLRVIAFNLIMVAFVARGATRTWTGAANNLWSNSTNWGLVLPVNGDSLSFPVNAGNKSSINNLGVTNYNTIFLLGSNYVFSGGGIPLTGGILATNSGGTNTFGTPIVLRADQTFSQASGFGGVGNPTLQLAGVLDLSGHNLTWTGAGALRMVAPIVGQGNITLNASLDEALFASVSSFTGLVDVIIMDLRLGHPLALGSTNGGVLANGGTLILNPGISITNESLEFSTGALRADGGTNAWAGPLTNGVSFLGNLDVPTPGSLLRISGPITGSGGYLLTGPGTVSYFGGATNTYTGLNRLFNNVTFLLEKPAGVPASSSRIEAFEGSTIRLGASEQINNNRNVALADNSLLDLNGFTETIAFLAGVSNLPPGRVAFGSSGTNQLIVNSSTTTNFAGSFSGAGSLVKLGSSTWTLQGTNASTGPTIVGNGSLIVDGRFNTSLLLVTNGTLGGTGTVASITLTNASASLNPGPTNSGTGRLIVTNALSIFGGKLAVDLLGTTVASQYDQVRVGGALRLSNAVLEATLGFTPAPGTSFTIIDNTGTGAVLGQFTGLPEGAVIDASGQLLRISYFGGTGNDITLTKVTNAVTGITRAWSGGGANNLWMNPTNWGGGVRPQGGDRLYFPPGAARPINTNDFPPAFFDAVIIGGSGYDLRGNSVTLLGGLTATNSSGSSRIAMPLTLVADQTVAELGSGTLNVSGAIDLSSNDVTVNAVGAVSMSSITGSGRLTKVGLNELSVVGTNALAGTNFVNEGSLFVGGVVTGRVVLASATSLSGLGYIGQLQCASGSTVTCGDFPDPGRLNIGNEFRLASGSTLSLKLNSAGAGIGYDQVFVTNAVSTVVLSNATLQLDLSFVPASGSTFTIIDKPGGDVVLGTFNGLPEGSVFLRNNVLLRISYVGGSGNDVVLTVLPSSPTGLTRAWTGAAFPNTNWSNPTNWSGNTLPASGDALFFSGTLPDVQKTNAFDLPFGTVFDRFAFGDGQCRYRIFGTNAVLLLNGIIVTNATFGPSFTVPIELLADQVFSNAGPSGLRVTTVRTDGHQLTFDGAGAFVVDGDVSGAGALVKRGPGSLRLNVATTFTGPVAVHAGSLEVNSTSGLGAVGAGTTVDEGSSLVLVSSGHNFGEPLTLAGTLSAGTTTNITWSGPITLVAPEGAADVAAGGALRVVGVMSGSGGLMKTGTGALTLAATNTFAGPTVVQAGTLFANGIHTNSPITVNATGTLGGTGMVASVAVNGGSLGPGLANLAGTLRVNGDLSVNASGTLALDFDGLSPGTGYDQVIVGGNVQLGGKAAVSVGFAVPLATTFIIIRNDGTNPVSGSFAGVPQGGTFVSGLVNWQVDYNGGDGNDVALTAVPFVPTGITSVWTGGGKPNFFWTNASNWVGNIAPVAGNDLLFPTVVASGFITNNFPADVFFNSLRFDSQSSYFIFSQANLSLLSGIVVTNSPFPPFVISPIRLLADQTFHVSLGSLYLSDILLNEHELICDGDGSIAVGAISGVAATEIISGHGVVRKRGSGSLSLQRTNTYTGLTFVEGGTIGLSSGATLGSPADGTLISEGAVLQCTGNNTNAEPLTLSGTLAFQFASSSLWTGPITLASSNATFDIATNSVLHVSSLISGSTGFIKTNTGTLVLDADNVYSGETRVQAGTLVISNSHLGGAVTLRSNTTFIANGQIGGLTSVGATLGAGTLTAAGLLQVNGALTLDAATKFDVDIDGVIPGTNYDQMRVAGPVNLGGAQLALGISVSAPIGSAFVIIRKDTPGAVTGTFAGLPQGTTFARGAFLWQIDYFGIDGNDVVLRVISQSLPGVVWDGGGADTNWLTGANWLSDVTPSPGADLIFSNEADQRTNFNNFASGTVFNGLRFTGLTNFGTGFVIGGNPISLTTGIFSDGNAAFNTLNFDIALANGAAITTDSGLRFTGIISNPPSGLVLSGNNTIVFAGPMRGPGGLTSSANFVQLSGTNTYTGPTILHAPGTLRLQSNGALGDPTNVVTVDAGASLQISLNDIVVPNPINLAGSVDAFVFNGTNTLAGPLILSGPTPALHTSFGTLNVTGPIGGNSDLLIGFTNFAFGTVVLAADTSHTGVTRLLGGNLFVNGISSASAFITSSNSALGGSGQLGSLDAAGGVAPGRSGVPAILRVIGAAALSDSSSLSIAINGPNPGADHSQLRVGGTVSLGNAALQVSQGAFTPAIGSVFTIIRNDSAAPVSGVFRDLPEGSFITNCAVFQLSYHGGDGNDVVLITAAQKGTGNLWTGNGADTNWTTAANWFCNLPPNPGDELVFSNFVSKLVVRNDFPPGTVFSGLSFIGFNFGSGFTLQGNAITLTNRIFALSSDSTTINLPITMGSGLVCSNLSAPVIFRGGITNGGHDLTLTGGGAFDFASPYSGSGGLSYINTNSFFGQLTLRTNNPYAGPTVFIGPVAVFVDDPNSLGDPASGTFVGESVDLIVRKPMTFAEPLVLAGRLDLANGSNIMTAPLTIAGSNTLLCVTSPRMEFNGPINGTGRLQFCGVATNLLNAGGNFIGQLQMFGGRQIFMGQYPGADLLVAGNSFFSTSVEGTGRVGAIRAHDEATNSVIAPGFDGPGILTCSSLIVESNITLRMELNGTVPGSGYDQLVVGGSLALTNCTLELSFGFTPGPADSFLIVNNTSSAPVAGTFENLPEGTLITNGATVLQITYSGGNGNDIVLHPPGAIQASLRSLVSLPDGSKQFEILGRPNATYVIEATAELLSPPEIIPWTPISTNTADGAGLLLYLDTDATNHIQRFYRAKER